jgi:cation:H+ antiporter
MHMLTWIIVFIASLAVLVKASDLFVNAAEKIGQSFGMPHFIIGVVIVGAGTSLPELVSSVLAVIGGTSEIVVGNVLGSNMTNIFLILGIAGVVGKNLRISYDILEIDLPIFLGAALLIAFMIYDGNFSRGEAIICLLGLFLFVLNTLKGQKQKGEDTARKPAGVQAWAMLLASSVLIFLGAKYTVDSVIALSKIFNIGAEVIALSAVALGTSLPEVLVTITAARKGKPEMAIGNVMGSNIFNSFAVMGIPGLIGSLHIPEDVISFALPFSIAATFLYVIIIVDRKLNLWEGCLLLLFYLFFLLHLLGIA